MNNSDHLTEEQQRRLASMKIAAKLNPPNDERKIHRNPQIQTIYRANPESLSRARTRARRSSKEREKNEPTALRAACWALAIAAILHSILMVAGLLYQT